ncbi:MAG: Deacetylase sirtuin-type protein [Gammaproteobacteria bacterium]|nr:Deacetylase sirtuin-type protein [Gammaproteobacteria bacterium]
MTGNSSELASLKRYFSDKQTRITVLTGAGISAESGIPTFRGPEGYWTVGSKVYMPQEMATLSMFGQQPLAVWQWYLYRLGVCLHAEPNAGHHALVRMEQQLADRFGLITQNIDNLHIRAGNSLQRTLQIHGNINHTRCSGPCGSQLRPLPDALKRHRTEQTLATDEIRLLHCPDCGAWLRPHVLWFDEYYDEEYFRYESAMALANRTDLLIIVGTSGATTLPNQVAMTVYNRGKTIIDINPEENPFSELAMDSPDGQFIRAAAAVILPQIATLCTT